jgi:branched-chain amino acid aminotransferase
MTETVKIEIQRTLKSRLPGIDFNNLPFGKVYTDHMFIADFFGGEWQNARITPFSFIPMSPACPAIHYGQSIFEGIKAHKSSKGDVLIFRPRDNWKRMNISGERMCMPLIPEDLFMESLRELIDLDRAWIPGAEGSSLYIRPFMFSADEYIGIRPSDTFTYMVILSPVGPYYSAPVKVKVETHFTRAVAGGTGYAKAGGNYGGAIYPAKLAQDKGYHQLIWTDGKEHKYIEESGTMNVMFVWEDKIITPALSDSILAGITRESVLHLAASWNIPVEERKIPVTEIIEGLKNGKVKEAFGVGTAATIAPIVTVGFEDNDYHLSPVEEWKIAPRILTELNAIKYGEKEDTFGWTVKL